jgi:hypothetical protein
MLGFLPRELIDLRLPTRPIQIGLLLHQDINQYTNVGVTTLWAQCASDWNGAGPLW